MISIENEPMITFDIYLMPNGRRNKFVLFFETFALEAESGGSNEKCLEKLKLI